MSASRLRVNLEKRRFDVLLIKFYGNVQKEGCLYTSDGMKIEFQFQNYKAWTMVYVSLTQSILDFAIV